MGPVDEEKESKLESEERRRYPRAPLRCLVQYRFENFDEFLAEYAHDVSKGGIFIKTEHPREVGTLVYLQFTLNDGSRLIEGLGRVARVCLPGDPGSVPGMGIEFVNVDRESMTLIESIVSGSIASKGA